MLICASQSNTMLTRPKLFGVGIPLASLLLFSLVHSYFAYIAVHRLRYLLSFFFSLRVCNGFPATWTIGVLINPNPTFGRFLLRLALGRCNSLHQQFPQSVHRHILVFSR